MSESGGRVFFRPFSMLYFTFLLMMLLVLLPLLTMLFRGLLVRGLGIPPESVGFVLLVSLLGSHFNIPFTSVESLGPITTYREVRFFGVTWRIPRVAVGVRKTLVTINVGGAVVPILISAYLLGYSIPACSPDPLLTYLKTLILMLVVALAVHRSARVVKGLGIATPAFGPPAITALTTVLIHLVSSVSCPTQIAYVGGTLGTLIGADLMNLNRLPELGVPVVSIGGAGTFDGIYITGLVSVVFVLLLL